MENKARAFDDRLAVANMAYKHAMAALQEVGARLGGAPPAAIAGENAAAVVAATATVGVTQAAPPMEEMIDVIADATVPAEEAATEPENTERLVGMDVMYASEPPSEMPFAPAPPCSSDPVPETETAAPAPDTQTLMPLPTRRASSADAAEGRPSAGAATQEAAAVLGETSRSPKARDATSTDFSTPRRRTTARPRPRPRRRPELCRG